MKALPPLVIAVTSRLIAELDDLLPGQLQAFYLVGSLALDDFIAGQSDIDFVAVIDGEANLDALARLHAELSADFPDIDCDGIYLRPGELSAPPSGSGVEARGGRIDPASAAERHPVTWLILADAGITLRGPAPRTSWIAADRTAVMAYSKANLSSYWQPWLEQRRNDPQALLDDDAVVWGSLGIARLHATIATGQVPSKSGAGNQALTSFPEHRRIIQEALRLRRHPTTPSFYATPQERREHLIAFMHAVLDENATS